MKKVLFLFIVLLVSIFTLAKISNAEIQNQYSTSLQPINQMEENKTLNFTIILKLQNSEYIDQYIKEVNDPNSQHYHKFLTQEEYKDVFYPKQSDIENIENSLIGNGFDVLSVSDLSMKVSADVGSIEKFFGVTLNYYQDGEKDYFGSLDPIQIPSNISGFISGTIGLDNFTEIRPFESMTRPENSFVQAPFIPSYILGAYSFNSLNNSGINGNEIRVAIVDAYGDPNIVNDLNDFSSEFGLPNATLNINYTDGTPTTTDFGWAGETAMDVEWVHAIAPYATIDLVITPNPDSSLMFDGVKFVIDRNFDSVMSLSWGLTENHKSSNFIRGFDDYLQLAAAKGISVFVSSGDNGAYDDGYHLSSEYPSTSPYVTSVGGTSLFLNSTDNSYNHEEAWNSSGGGHSIFFPKPYWQYGINVSNDKFRDVPDVAMDADPFLSAVYIIVNGFDVPFSGGTSLSAPMWAGIAALVNQKINGRIGLINPLIYQLAGSGTYGSDFHDITSGNNGYYYAGSYYDQVTGWGTPIATNLVNDISSLYFQENTNVTFSNFGTNPNNLTTYAQQTYTFYTTISDNLGTINNVSLYLDGAQYSTSQNGSIYLASLDTLNAGNHNYFWYALENHCVSTQSQIITYTINKADPKIFLTLDNQSNSLDLLYGQNLDVKAVIDVNQGLSNFSLFLNDTSLNSGGSNLSASIRLQPGFYVISANYSGSQNYSSSSASINATVLPILSVYNPLNTTYLFGTNFTFSFIAQSIDDSYNLIYYLNKNQSSNLEILNGTLNSINVGLLIPGFYNLTFFVFNGTLNDTTEIDFTSMPSDSAPPTISNSIIVPTISKTNSNVTFFATIDDISGVNSANISIYNESWYPIYQEDLNNFGDNWFATFNNSNFSEGVYYVNLSTADVFDNIITLWTSNMTVNQTAGALTTFTNNLISTNNNQSLIDASGSVGVILQITTNKSLSNECVGISEFTSNPTPVQLSVLGLGKYYQIEPSSNIKNNLLWVLINVSYNPPDVSAVGIDPSALRIYYYDSTSGSWIPFDAPNGGVDTINHFIWANSTHFSFYGVFIKPTCDDGIQNQGETGIDCGGPCSACPTSSPVNINAVPVSSSPNALSASSCEESWNCTQWSDCFSNNTQTRSCVDLSRCGTRLDKPNEARNCIYIDNSKKPVCGNGICETGETQTNCCLDCGCSEGSECRNNTCSGKTSEKIQTSISSNPLTGLTVFVFSPIGIATIVFVIIVFVVILITYWKNFFTSKKISDNAM